MRSIMMIDKLIVQEWKPMKREVRIETRCLMHVQVLESLIVASPANCSRDCRQKMFRHSPDDFSTTPYSLTSLHQCLHPIIASPIIINIKIEYLLSSSPSKNRPALLDPDCSFQGGELLRQAQSPTAVNSVYCSL
jgi:hypothetical protein